ncbi:hypothetical protein [Stenotrophomonas sp. 57]|uniref:hypothetical protein n=1 Tax=Stenotrophomonas sp. 57 TaxID=3051119 RepID=UPI00256EA2FC|nr:hypothetical protein [Stenotrophomonas sp. 57]
MARQIIDTTTDHGTYKGDPAKVAFEKVNANDAELYGMVTGVAALGGSNMLINCGLPINQRAFAGGALSAGAYGYDRWKAGAGGCNVTINATTGVFTHTSGPLQQIVEAPQLAWGQPLTISVENPSGSISVSVGGATGTITAGSGRRGVTLTPSGSGNMTVQLSATGVTYSRPKLERGSAATPFEHRPVALEQLLCQRYYWRSGTFASANYLGVVYGVIPNGGETRATVCLFFPVAMRVKPAMTTFNPNDSSSSTGLLIGIANVAYQSIDYDSAGIYQVNFASAQVAGRSFIFKVGLDAEL